MEGSAPLPDDVPLTMAEMIILCVTAGIGIVANSLVMYVLACVVASHRGNTNILLVNQSLIDLVTSILAVLCFIAPGPQRSPSSTPAGERFMCYVWNSKYLFWSAIITSTANLLLLTFERYYATLHPFRYRSQHWLAWPRSLLVATLPWIVGHVLQSYSLAMHSMDEKNQCHLRKFHNQSQKVSYSIIIVVILYVIPLALMTFAYVKIYRALLSSTGRMSGERAPLIQTTRDRQARRRDHSTQRNVIKTLVMVCGAYGILWLPNQFAYLYYNLNDNVHLSMHLYSISICIALGNMCVNPLIYALQYNQFRQGLRIAFPCLARREDANNSNQTQTQTQS